MVILGADLVISTGLPAPTFLFYSLVGVLKERIEAVFCPSHCVCFCLIENWGVRFSSFFWRFWGWMPGWFVWMWELVTTGRRVQEEGIYQL